MGCGMGWFASQLAQFGPTTGIDLSDDAIAQAKSNFPQVTFMAGNVFEMELPERQFDVVVSQEVIAHVPDQPGYVEHAARGTKPGGYLIVTTPNRFVHFRNQWPPSPSGHIEQWLSRGALKRLLRPHFRVLRTTTAVPIGRGGILRLVHSTKLNWAFGLLFSPRESRLSRSGPASAGRKSSWPKSDSAAEQDVPPKYGFGTLKSIFTFLFTFCKG